MKRPARGCTSQIGWKYDGTRPDVPLVAVRRTDPGASCPTTGSHVSEPSCPSKTRQSAGCDPSPLGPPREKPALMSVEMRSRVRYARTAERAGFGVPSAANSPNDRSSALSSAATSSGIAPGTRSYSVQMPGAGSASRRVASNAARSTTDCCASCAHTVAGRPGVAGLPAAVE